MVKQGTFFVVLTLKFLAKKRQMSENIAFSIDCSYSFSSRELHEIKFKTHIKISVEHFDFYYLVLTVKKTFSRKVKMQLKNVVDFIVKCFLFEHKKHLLLRHLTVSKLMLYAKRTFNCSSNSDLIIRFLLLQVDIQLTLE